MLICLPDIAGHEGLLDHDVNNLLILYGTWGT